jgi:hypothetical protein
LPAEKHQQRYQAFAVRRQAQSTMQKGSLHVKGQNLNLAGPETVEV